jgi:hypothetical protein
MLFFLHCRPNANVTPHPRHHTRHTLHRGGDGSTAMMVSKFEQQNVFHKANSYPMGSPHSTSNHPDLPTLASERSLGQVLAWNMHRSGIRVCLEHASIWIMHRFGACIDRKQITRVKRQQRCSSEHTTSKSVLYV